MMRIKALEDFEYIPEFGGNRKEKSPTSYTFTLLSGSEDMALRKEGSPMFPDSLESIITAVKNPPVIVESDGKEVEASISDIAERAELKGLFMELIVEYGKHSALSPDSGKG